MSQPYFDTSLVLKLVIPEPLTPAVQQFLQKRSVSVPYPKLVELELENTLQAKVFRKELTRPQLRRCLDFVSDLIKRGNLFRPVLSLDEVAVAALELTPKITAKTGCRTLDLLHIVSAQNLGYREFVTGDHRQALAARRCGLKVIEISR